MLYTEHCSSLKQLALGQERVGEGLAVVPAKAMHAGQVDASMGTSPGSTPGKQERGGELGSSLPSVKLQLCFRWCSQAWGETGKQ